MKPRRLSPAAPRAVVRATLAAFALSLAGLAAQSVPPPLPPAPPVLPPPPRPLPILVPPTSPQEPAPGAPLTPVTPGPLTRRPLVTPQVTSIPPIGGIGTMTAFQWDAERKESVPAPGEQYANYTFWFTNVSKKEVVINSVRTSCGCTLARLPATPWHVPPGTNGPIEVALDLRGKMGVITKSITVDSTDGYKSLIIQATLPAGGLPADAPAPHTPAMAEADRLANMQKALADRQVVFKDAACAKCHADPARNVADGHALYRGVCAVCHDSPLRAAAVPDLRALKNPTDLDYWKHWITHGKPGSMMPSFAQSAGAGGPLTDPQVAALAAYCQASFQPARPAAAIPFQPTGTNTSAISVFPLPPAPKPAR